MFYVLGKDFFSSSYSLESIAFELDKRVKNERVIVNFDPFACHKWTSLIDKSTEDDNLVLNVAQAYYSNLESMNSYSLDWYDLNSSCNYYIDTLGELLANFNFNDYQVCACGVLPISYSGIECCLYYNISPYEDLNDKFYFINRSDFYKIMEEHKIGVI